MRGGWAPEFWSKSFNIRIESWWKYHCFCIQASLSTRCSLPPYKSLNPRRGGEKTNDVGWLTPNSQEHPFSAVADASYWTSSQTLFSHAHVGTFFLRYFFLLQLTANIIIIMYWWYLCRSFSTHSVVSLFGHKYCHVCIYSPCRPLQQELE